MRLVEKRKEWRMDPGTVEGWLFVVWQPQVSAEMWDWTEQMSSRGLRMNQTSKFRVNLEV